MSLNAHIAELSEKHRILERRIAEAIASPAADDAEITRLKSEKLRLKDEIARLKSETKH